MFLAASAQRSAAVGHGDDDDSILAKAATSGDAQAFTAIVERYQSPIYNLCLRYLHRVEDAEDTAQEAFIRAFVHREKFDPNRPLAPWLMTIARRLCIDRLRRGDNERISHEKGERLQDPAPSAEQNVASRQELNTLASELENLPEGQREAISLYHLDGLTYEETAEVLDVPKGTVMTWLFRGRARLREAIRGTAGLPKANQGGQ